MSDNKMTLEQVRDELRCFYNTSIHPAWPSLEAWADAIDAHLTTPPKVAVLDIPLGAIENGRAFAERLEATGLDCEAGDLKMCSDWQEFRQCFEFLAEWAISLSARLAQPVVAKAPEELPRNGVTVREHEYNAGWNDCREVMLSHMNESQPHSQAAQGGEAQGKVVERAAEIIDILSSQRQSHGAQEES